MKVALPDLVSNSYFPAIAAVDLGCFAAEGIDAELELLFPVPKTMEALREGRYDFVAGSAHATLMAFPEWQGAKLLVALAKHTYWFLVLRKDLNAERGDISKVKGLRIGAAPGVDLSFKHLLREAGVDPDRDNVQVGPVPGTADSVSFGVTAAKALEEGRLDGFWANGMGAEVAVERGVGTIVLDLRRGVGPAAAQHYTFGALVTTDRLIQENPKAAAAAVRAIVRAQQALREDPNLATAIGQKRFPPQEASLIAELIRRDLPYYDPTITPETVATMNQFAMAIGLLKQPVPFDQVVATQFSPLWTA